MGRACRVCWRNRSARNPHGSVYFRLDTINWFTRIYSPGKLDLYRVSADAWRVRNIYPGDCQASTALAHSGYWCGSGLCPLRVDKLPDYSAIDGIHSRGGAAALAAECHDSFCFDERVAKRVD